MPTNKQKIANPKYTSLFGTMHMGELFCPSPFKSNHIFHILFSLRIPCINESAEILRHNSVDMELKKMNIFWSGYKRRRKTI